MPADFAFGDWDVAAGPYDMTITATEQGTGARAFVHVDFHSDPFKAAVKAVRATMNDQQWIDALKKGVKIPLGNIASGTMIASTGSLLDQVDPSCGQGPRVVSFCFVDAAGVHIGSASATIAFASTGSMDFTLAA